MKLDFIYFFVQNYCNKLQKKIKHVIVNARYLFYCKFIIRYSFLRVCKKKKQISKKLVVINFI